MRLVPDRLGAKLNLSIVLFVLLLAAATALVVYAGFEGATRLVLLLCAFAALLIIAIAGTAVLVRRLVLGPIDGIVRGTRAIAAGDLESRIEVRSGDELGVLAESFNAMTAELSRSRALLDAQQDQLRASEEELRALFAAMTDVVFVMSRDGEYLRAAPTIPALSHSRLNRTATLVGKRLEDVLEPDVAQAGLAAIHAALSKSDTQSFEYRVNFEDGEWRWFHASISPLTADSVLWVARDLTRRRADEQLIAEREQQYRLVFETATDAMFITDLEDNIIDANTAARELHGYTLEEMQALPPFSLTAPEYRPGVAEGFRDITSGKPIRGRIRNIRKDGTTFPSDALATPITFRGKPHVLVVLRDISEQAEGERLLEQRVADRTREVESMLHVSQAVASSLDLGAVAHTILQELARVADYTGATLAAIEGDDLVILDSFGPFRDEVLRGPTARIPLRAVSRPLWAALQTGEPIVIDDTHDDSDVSTMYRRIFGQFLEMPSFASIRSWLAVPLMRQGQLIGMLTAAHEETHHFTRDTANLVAAAAGQAAVAIENARLYQEAQQRSRELTSLLGVSRGVVSTLETAPLLETILREVNSVAPYDSGAFMILNGDFIEEVAVASNLGGGHELESHLGRRFRVGQNAQMWRAIASGEPIIIDDVRGDTPAARAYQSAVGDELRSTFGDVRSWLGVPVATKDRVLGMLALARTVPGFYTERHGELAAAFGAQAAVALENARLFEQSEARTHELATPLDVSRNVASTLELQPLLELVLEQVASVAQYDRASVLTLDGDVLRVLSVADRRATGPVGAPPGAEFHIPPDSDLWASLSKGHITLMEDVRDDSLFSRNFRRDVAPQVDPELRHVRAWLGAPLMLHDQVIGLLTLVADTPSAFNERQGALVQAIGLQAAVAIENARLYEESQQQARETEALLRADEELFRSLDLNEVLHALVDVTIDVMRADKCILTLVEAGEEHVVASRNFSAEGLVTIDRQVRERSRAGVKPPDHPFVLNNIEEERRPAAREMWASEGIRSYMALPIRAGGQLIGGFGVAYTSPHRFGEGERRVFQALAERGGAAIQNAELYERAQHAASLEERQRLARELHDSVSQALYGIALGARTARTQLDRDPALAVEPVDYVLSLAEAGLAEMRALIFELRPESLELEGIVAGLEKQAAALRARHGIDVHADLCAEPEAPLAIKEAVSRIAQEAMHNTVKHARASRVSLRLCSDDGHLSLQVSDDGRGFDPSQPYAGHLGLRSMRERAEKLGGTFEITSEPGSGSQIAVSIPLPSP